MRERGKGKGRRGEGEGEGERLLNMTECERGGVIAAMFDKSK